MDTENKYSDLIELSKNYMRTIKDNEHNVNHINDVVNYTKELLNVVNINVNKDVCIIGAYWHDVGRTKLSVGHEKLSAEMLRNDILEVI